MKGNHLKRYIVLLASLFLIINPGALSSSPLLNQTEIEYVNTLTQDLTKVINDITTFATKFVDPQDKYPLSSYIQQLHQKRLLLKQITKDLNAKKKDKSLPLLYQDAINTTLTILNNLNANLITPVYTALSEKKKKKKKGKINLNCEDRALFMALALQVSVDEFYTSASKTLLQQLRTLHKNLNQLNLAELAQTIEGVLDLLVTAEKDRQVSLTEEEKRTIRKAILLKIKLNK